MNTDFSWVDEFFQNVKPYIYVRAEDNLLIKRPNEVQQMNEAGTRILSSLLRGVKINTLLEDICDSYEKNVQVYHFLTAIRASIDGHLSLNHPAVLKKPFEMGMNKYPVLSELAVTYRCNLKCRFCYAGCNTCSNPVGNNTELSTEDFKIIIEKISLQAKVPSISFTGGEPLLRADLYELIRHAKTFDMRVNLITNGTLIKQDEAEKLLAAGLDSVQISIEGTDALTHDYLTGTTGSFQKTLDGIAFMKKTGMHVHTNTTLNRQNITQAAAFPGFIRHELGLLKFSMNMMLPSGSAVSDDNLKLHYEEMGQYLDVILDESKKNKVEFMWYSPLPLCMFNTITHGLGNKGCSACDGLLSVAPDGHILPCASYDEPLGSLIEKDFDMLWHSKRPVFFRKKQFAHSYCRACEHFSVCQGACPLYWRTMGFSELDGIINEKK